MASVAWPADATIDRPNQPRPGMRPFLRLCAGPCASCTFEGTPCPLCLAHLTGCSSGCADSDNCRCNHASAYDHVRIKDNSFHGPYSPSVPPLVSSSALSSQCSPLLLSSHSSSPLSLLSRSVPTRLKPTPRSSGNAAPNPVAARTSRALSFWTATGAGCSEFLNYRATNMTGL